MEGTADFQLQRAFGTGGEHQFASLVDTGNRAGDNDLARAVIVGADNNFVRNLGAEFFDLRVGEGEDGSHRRGRHFARLLHRHGAVRNQSQTILERQGAGSDEGGEFAERVSGHHVGLEVVAQRLGQDDGVEEDGGLRNLRLLQIFVRTGEHQVGDAEAEDIISLLK